LGGTYGTYTKKKTFIRGFDGETSNENPLTTPRRRLENNIKLISTEKREDIVDLDLYGSRE
jgi:hypothetical protein